MISIVGPTMNRMTVVMTMVVTTAVALMLWGCGKRPVMSQASFVHLQSGGWRHDAPLAFTPQYADSATTYSLTLAVRHTNSYAYSNLSLVVDVINVDSLVTRHKLDMRLADGYGNWLGGGFGTLYQDTAMVAAVIDPDDATRVIVWQAMQGCDTLRGITDIGLIARPL